MKKPVIKVDTNDLSPFREIVEYLVTNDNSLKGLSSYAVNVNFRWSKIINTACAGHGFIFFNPDFWIKLTEKERITVIAHEFWHLILNHLSRGLSLDQDKFNIATDYCINLILQKQGHNVKTSFGNNPLLIDEQYDGLSSESIYKLLPDLKKIALYIQTKSHDGKKEITQIQINGQTILDPTDRETIESLIEEECKKQGTTLTEQIEKTKKELEKALEASKGQGGPDNNVDRVLKREKYQSKIKRATYQEVFKKHLTNPLSGGKRTFMRNSRRQINNSLRIKGKFRKRGGKNRLKHLVYALDTSGSITEEQANEFFTSASEIKKIMNPSLMTVLLWDARIRAERIFTEFEPMERMEVSAGGWTCLQDVWKRMKQLEPDTLVIFTDLLVNFPPKPEWEVIWIVPSEYERNPATMPTLPDYGEIFVLENTRAR